MTACGLPIPPKVCIVKSTTAAHHSRSAFPQLARYSYSQFIVQQEQHGAEPVQSRDVVLDIAFFKSVAFFDYHGWSRSIDAVFGSITKGFQQKCSSLIRAGMSEGQQSSGFRRSEYSADR